MSASISALNTLSLTGHSLYADFITSNGVSVPLEAVMDVFASVFIIAAVFMFLFYMMELIEIAVSYLRHKVKDKYRSNRDTKRHGENID